jgi:GDYXXLXY protein
MGADLRGKAILAMLAADLAVFGAWIGSLQAARAGDHVRLPVEGFDPRDLLSGHYVRFRLVAEREAAPLVPSAMKDGGGPVEFCAESSGGFLHPVRFRAPAESCRFVLRGESERGMVHFPADRFYIDERRAGQATSVRAGPDTYVVATLDERGGVHVVDLVVGGKSLAPSSR